MSDLSERLRQRADMHDSDGELLAADLLREAAEAVAERDRLVIELEAERIKSALSERDMAHENCRNVEAQLTVQRDLEKARAEQAERALAEARDQAGEGARCAVCGGSGAFPPAET